MFDTAKSIVPSATVSRGQYLTCDIKTVQFMPGEHGVFQTLTKRKLVIWDTSQFVPAETMRLNTLSSPAMSAFRSNGKQICITHNDGVNFYDFKSGSIRAEISDTKLSGVLCCDWSSTKSVLLAVGTAKGEMFLYDVRQSKQPVLCYHKRKRKLDKGINELPVDQVKFGLCDASLWAIRRHQGVFEMSKKGVVINSINANLVQKFQLVKSHTLCYTNNTSLVVYDLRRRHIISELKGHLKCVADFSYVSGRHELVSMGVDGIMLKWNCHERRPDPELHTDHWSDSE